MKEFYNLLLFIAICFVVYLVFRSFHYNPMLIEGMTDASGNIANRNTANGIAGNAASYAASLKAYTIKSQDTLLISKYRSDYESAILNLDDLINNLMLKTTLSVNQNNPVEAIIKLGQMQQAKLALNSVMKFVDTQ
jgi:hypothetical protein